MPIDPEKALNLPAPRGRKQGISGDSTRQVTLSGPPDDIRAPKFAQQDLVFR
jgi:hypothetical protein